MNCGGVIVIRQRAGYPDETIMVKTKAGHYGFPKGKRNKGESDYGTAIRELGEETGIKEDEIKFCVQSENGNCYKFLENKIVYYLALLKSSVLVSKEKTIKFDPDELADVRWVQITSALAMENHNLKQIRKDILTEAYLIFQQCTCFREKPEVKEQKSKEKNNYVPAAEVVAEVKKVYKPDSLDNNNMSRISKRLSWILRHGAVDLGLKVNTDGSVLLDDILKMPDFKNVNVKDIKKVVDNNDKKRFGLSEDPVNGSVRIRANQGHSHKVAEKIENDALLKKVTTPFPICFHGTYRKFAEKIKKTGLNRMGRKHIHLTNSLDAVSGVRSNVNALVYIDMAAAMNDGMIFYLSDNDVILTEGIDGNIDPKYISNIKYK